MGLDQYPVKSEDFHGPVLVTGAGGCIGSWVLALLERAGVPVVAFGSHVAVTVLEAAHARGADFVMPRSQFTANLPTILERFGGAAV